MEKTPNNLYTIKGIYSLNIVMRDRKRSKSWYTVKIV